MTIKDELRQKVEDIFSKEWTVSRGEVVPAADDLRLGNHGKLLDGVVLYADLEDSTQLVTRFKKEFAAEVFKSFLLSCCAVIRQNDGVIVSFDGDRVMAVFLGPMKNSNAAKSGLMINWSVRKLIEPALRQVYSASDYSVRHVVGIDSGEILAARTGVRNNGDGNSNDVCWVSPAANLAAKMCAIRGTPHRTIISASVYHKLANSAKLGGSPPRSMWEAFTWSAQGRELYGSNWSWSL